MIAIASAQRDFSKSTQMCSCMIETSLVPPWKSSVLFGKLRKVFGNVHLAFGTILEKLRKSSECGRKSSELKSSKTWLLLCFIINISCGYDFYLLVLNSISHSKNSRALRLIDGSLSNIELIWKNDHAFLPHVSVSYS